MPATEQTWRNQKLMHRIFAVSCLILLGATIWMFLADHFREWKDYQRNFRGMELVLMDLQQQQFETELHMQQHAELMRQLRELQAAPLDTNLIKEFQDEVNADKKERSVDDNETFVEENFSALDATVEALAETAKKAREARQAAKEAQAAAKLAENEAVGASAKAKRLKSDIGSATDKTAARAAAAEAVNAAAQASADATAARKAADEKMLTAAELENSAASQRSGILSGLDTYIKAAKFREDLELRRRKFGSADVDAAKGTLGLAHRDDKVDEFDKLQANVNDKKADVDKHNRKYEGRSEHRLDLEEILKRLTAEEAAAQKVLADHQSGLDRLTTAGVERRSTYFTGSFPFFGKKWLELPILDAFNSPLKIETKWDDENRIDFNFSRVRRYDRCTTCHQAMEKTMPGSATEPAFVDGKLIDFILTTPAGDGLPTPESIDGGEPVRTLNQVYGIRLAASDQYILDRNDATIGFVQPFGRDLSPKAASVNVPANTFKGKFSLAGTRGVLDQSSENWDKEKSVAENINAQSASTGVQAAEVDGEITLSSIDLGSHSFVLIREKGKDGQTWASQGSSGLDDTTLALAASIPLGAGAFDVGDDFSLELELTSTNRHAILSMGIENKKDAKGKEVEDADGKKQKVLVVRVDGDKKPVFEGAPRVASVVEGINAAAGKSGVQILVREIDGVGDCYELTSLEKGDDAFIQVEVLRESGSACGDRLAKRTAQGRDLTSSLGAQAILAESGSEKVLGALIRKGAFQPTTVESSNKPDIRPGLMIGDIIEFIDGDKVESPQHALRMLLTGRTEEDWGQPIRLTIRRGLRQPFTTHPRLDLFVGSLSPHKATEFGCSICHEGQGSATAFKWASHTPNDKGQKNEWGHDHGWFDNHHWIFPMYPKRFSESGCLKCHHEVDDLRPSERFPEAPAPKLVHGYDVIRKYGCYGCHEINGFDKPDERVGPDLRSEPGFFAAAQELLSHLSARVTEVEELRKSLGVEELESKLQEQGPLVAKKDALTQQKTDLATAQQPTTEVDAQLADVDKQLAAKDAEVAPLREKLAPINKHWETLKLAKELAESLTKLPTDNSTRHRLLQLIELDAAWEGNEYGRTLPAESHKLVELIADIESPGTLRKPGPSLRYIGSKATEEFLVDWIREPKHFRPQSRMPQFFGLRKHLSHHVDEVAQKAAKALAGLLTDKKLVGLAEHIAVHPHADHRMELYQATIGSDDNGIRDLASQLVGQEEVYEPIEILGITTYLRSRSQSYEYAKPEEGVAPPDATRGKAQFQERGCLACHSHNAFADAESYRDKDEIVQGPDLSGVAAKFGHEDGHKWLYSWLKDPQTYHARTKMPQLFLDPVKPQGKVTETTDPAADIAAFLLSDSSNNDWKPAETNLTRAKLDASEVATQTLDEVVLLNLQDAFSKRKAGVYLEKGIPETLRGELKGAEIELVGTEIGVDEKLMYIGRKAIGKYGCFGCHDIPAFEGAKPIGTGLADWGRKDPSKLAFNHIGNYLHSHHGGHGHGGHGHDDDGEHGHEADEDDEHHGDDDHDGEESNGMFGPKDLGFYRDALLSGHRAGFIYQKLVEPRSYDYHQTDNMKYNERLRMPQFPFTDEEREAVITFVMGLVADPPRPMYIYKPTKRQEAIVQGRKVLEKFNCAGCHMLESQKWDVTYPPGGIAARTPKETFPFLKPAFSPDQLAASATPDRQGNLHVTLSGLPAVAKPDGRAMIDGIVDLDGDLEEVRILDAEDFKFDTSKLTRSIDLYDAAAIDGSVFQTGVQPVALPEALIDQRHAAHGGFLAKYLVPLVAKSEPKKNTNKKDKADEAWGWVPPPLMGEGAKVQSDWLHDFLLDPYPIRPAVVLRMPRFNMSPEEATKLANYFAAIDDVDYPYSYASQRSAANLSDKEKAYANSAGSSAGSENVAASETSDGTGTVRFDDAMKMVSGKNGCVQCHIIGTFEPQGFDSDKAPNLGQVYRRLRPGYVRRWVAWPKHVLPYTSMPEMVPYKPNAPNQGGMSQSLYRGTSTEQLDALVDLLMNFDQYSVKRNSPAAPDAGETESDATGEEGNPDDTTDDGTPEANPNSTTPDDSNPSTNSDASDTNSDSDDTN